MSTDAVRVDAHDRRPRRWLRETALTIGALTGLLCVLVALSAFVFGVTPLVFRSGSMSPAIETGALALSKKTPAVDVRVGDIVNVTDAAGNGITHRVVEIGAVGSDSVELFLKGDANADPDAEPYVVSEAGRVLFSVPKLGYVVTWLSGPVAVFAGGVFVGVLLMIAFRPRDGERTPTDDEPETFGRHSKMPMSVFAVLATIGAVGLSSSNPPVALAAPLTDTSTVPSGAIQTVIPVPSGFRCDNVLLAGAQLSWTNNPALGYELSFTPVVEGVTNPVVLPPATGATRTYNSVQLASLLMVGTRTFTLRATFNGVRSAATGTRAISYTTALITSCQPAGPAGAAARLAPQAAQSTTTTPSPSSTTQDPTTTTPTPAPTTPPTTTPPPTTTTPPVTTTTTTTPPPVPADLIAPQTSPSGSAVAKVVSVDGSPTLQITDSSGEVQYSGPITSSAEYGYGVAWASGDQLWLLGPSQLVRLDGGASGWTRTIVEPTSPDIPAEIASRLN
ncbi:signal peptidase I [Rhodococcoides kyotonense]|uniref:Signal peptidase I n=1 Tax=Rhodococcoides kyotonense TaxID=398843 RepID=A0A177YLY9_9NOCA|nr:signal peptidase I [Rhodococcus kyotonensis]OAK56411.1 signal peptidase I [Rhodococcus kyotonensis]